MFLDSFYLWIEREKNIWRKTVLKMWFQKNGLICLSNCFEKKVRFQVFKFYVFLLFLHFFFKSTLWTNIAFFPQIWNLIFKTVFPKLFFLFSVQSSKLSINMRKLRVKLRNATIYPPWGPILQKKISSKTYSSLIWKARLAQKVTFESYWWEESGIFLIRGPKSHNFA